MTDTTKTTSKYSQALRDFLAMARRQDYLILDTETTGLHDGEVVSITIINAAGETLLDTLVKPSKPIPADATKIHGITDEMVKDSPTWDLLVSEILLIVANRHLIVYNAQYDQMVLQNSGKAYELGLSWNSARWHCAMNAFAEVYGDWNSKYKSYKWKQLSVAAEYYNLSTDGAHGALADCLMTLGVVRGMCEAIEINTP